MTTILRCQIAALAAVDAALAKRSTPSESAADESRQGTASVPHTPLQLPLLDDHAAVYPSADPDDLTQGVN